MFNFLGIFRRNGQNYRKCGHFFKNNGHIYRKPITSFTKVLPIFLVNLSANCFEAKQEYDGPVENTNQFLNRLLSVDIPMPKVKTDQTLLKTPQKNNFIQSQKARQQAIRYYSVEKQFC